MLDVSQRQRQGSRPDASNRAKQVEMTDLERLLVILLTTCSVILTERRCAPVNRWNVSLPRKHRPQRAARPAALEIDGFVRDHGEVFGDRVVDELPVLSTRQSAVSHAGGRVMTGVPTMTSKSFVTRAAKWSTSLARRYAADERCLEKTEPLTVAT